MALDSSLKDPKCRCCKIRVEYNSDGYRFSLCISCTEAVNRFLFTRQTNLKNRGLIK